MTIGERANHLPLPTLGPKRSTEPWDGIETKKFSSELIDYVVSTDIAAATVTYGAGQYVYYQEDDDDYLYLIVEGYVEILALTEFGQETIIDIVGPGALCGEGAAFDRMPRATTARTLMVSTLIRLSASSVMAAFGSHPQLARLLIGTISVKQRLLLERLAQVTQLAPHERVLRLLVQIGSNSEERLVAISHERIASLIGLTRVTVTRAIGKLCQSGAITKRGGKIYINSKIVVQPAMNGH